MGCVSRGQIRNKYSITTGDCADSCSDCLLHSFCTCCALSQEWRELKFRADQPTTITVPGGAIVGTTLQGPAVVVMTSPVYVSRRAAEEQRGGGKQSDATVRPSRRLCDSPGVCWCVVCVCDRVIQAQPMANGQQSPPAYVQQQQPQQQQQVSAARSAQRSVCSRSAMWNERVVSRSIDTRTDRPLFLLVSVCARVRCACISTRSRRRSTPLSRSTPGSLSRPRRNSTLASRSTPRSPFSSRRRDSRSTPRSRSTPHSRSSRCSDERRPVHAHAPRKHHPRAIWRR